MIIYNVYYYTLLLIFFIIKMKTRKYILFGQSKLNDTEVGLPDLDCDFT